MGFDYLRNLIYQRFEVDLCKESRWGPPKILSELEVILRWSSSSLCFKQVVRDESRVSGGWDASEEVRGGVVVVLKVLTDWWQPNEGRDVFGGKEKKPICVLDVSWSSNMFWLSIACEAGAIFDQSHTLKKFDFCLWRL